MINITDLLKQGKKDVIWKEYCGFLDLSTDEFVEFQKKLLQEQIELLKKCKLGKEIFGSKALKSVKEFRERVPFTTYSDYSKYFLNKREDVLPEKPYLWTHTSGRSGEYKYKWVPYTKKLYDLLGKISLTQFILCSCKYKGDVPLKKGDRIIYTLATPPYTSGYIMQSLLDQHDFQVFPTPEKAMELDFQERIQEGFKMAISEGLDFFYGVTSIMIKISEQFSQANKSMKNNKEFSKLIRNPKVLFRLLKAVAKAKLNKREIMPKDIWKVKGVMCAGSDTSIFKDRVEKLWGKKPFEAYGSTELGMIAIQPFNCEGMVFYPENNFWEFIPEKEYRKMSEDKSYVPRALLLNEVQPNQEYVLVGTSLHGGALIRYIIGDLIKIISLQNQKAGVNLPQMVFSSRVDDMIDIGGFTRLTEKTIWRAIENSKTNYTEWTVRKEYKKKQPILNLYIELKDDTNSDVSHIEDKIHECLKQLDEPYRDLEMMAGVKPLKVTVLSRGTFKRYFEERQAAGADLAHMKPTHINPPNKVIDKLLDMSSWEI